MSSKTKKKVLITGSSGFLGQHLLHSLLLSSSSSNNDNDNNDELDIYATYGSLKDFPESVRRAKDNGYRHHLHVDSLDLSNKVGVQDYLQTNGPFDVCLHLAAVSSPRICQQDPDRARALNIPKALFDGLLLQLQQQQPEHLQKPFLLVALSTDQVYDGQNAPYQNNAPTKPLNEYSKSKVDMEQYLMNGVERTNNTQNDRDGTTPSRPLSVVCLRSSIICGKEAPIDSDGAHKTFLHFCASRDAQNTTFYTDECRSVIAVTDVVRILTWFVKQKEEDKQKGTEAEKKEEEVLTSKDDAHRAKRSTNSFEVYNMGGPERVSRWDIAMAVAKQQQFRSTQEWIAAEKASACHDDAAANANAVPSPLDISMDSTALETLVGFSFRGLTEIVNETF